VKRWLAEILASAGNGGSLRIAAFVYDFPHEKSVQGLLHLGLAAPSDVLVLAAPRVHLSGRRNPPSLAAVEPRLIAEAQGFRYEIAPHESSAPLLGAFRPDCAFIFGARVLPQVVTSAGVPIVNLHPGVLPDNRGLDAAPWAVLHDLPQGVSAHLVSQRIDGGPLLATIVLPAYHVIDCQSIASVRSKLTDLELRLLRHLLLDLPMDAIKKRTDRSRSQLGRYHSTLTEDEHLEASLRFESYVARYSDLLESWRSRTAPLTEVLSEGLDPDATL